MDIPPELLRYETIKYLEYPEILSLCAIFPKLCLDDSLWRDLIQRDFDYQYLEANPREEYQLANYIHQTDISRTVIPDMDLFMWRQLRSLGYSLHEDVLILDNIDVSPVFTQMFILLYNASKNNCEFREEKIGLEWNFGDYLDPKMSSILPSIFEITEREEGTIFFLPVFYFRQNYDYYNGVDSFWQDFLTSIQDNPNLEKCLSTLMEKISYL